MHPLGKRPRRRALQADPRHKSRVDVRANRTVETVKQPDVRQRLKSAPAGEVADIRETEICRQARGFGRTDVGHAERRCNAGSAIELRIECKSTGILGIVTGLDRDGERAALVEAGQIKRGPAARDGLNVERLLGDHRAENIAYKM